MPYSLATNDGKYMAGIGNADQWFTLLKDSFDMLYREGKTQPRMMSVGMHMRVIGHPGRAVGLNGCSTTCRSTRVSGSPAGRHRPPLD